MSHTSYNSDDTDDLQQQLFYFIGSDQTERTVETARLLLQKDPEAAWVHQVLGSALIDKKEFDTAQIHLEKTIALDPDNADAYAHRARLELNRNRAGIAEDYIAKAIQLDPTEPWNWYIAGLLAIHFDDYNRAMLCATKIREFDPENIWADKITASARSDIDGKNKVSKEQQLNDQFTLLEKNPHSDETLNNIALIYANEYADWEKAEKYAREAVAADPQDRSNQKLLLKVLRKRDFALKIMWMPFLPVKWIIQLNQWAWEKKWPLILTIPTAKIWLSVGACSFCIFGVFFWPLAKAYELITLADIHKKMGKLSIYSSPLARLHKLPFKVRFSIFVIIMIVFWGTIAVVLSDKYARDLALSALIIGTILIVKIVVIGSWVYYFYDKHKQSKRAKKLN